MAGSPATVHAAETAIEEIVVSAQRREQNLQAVPISITVFSGDQLNKGRIEGLQDYLEMTPNVSFRSSGSSNDYAVAIRGISNIGGQFNVFGIYVDEFNVAPLASAGTYDQKLVDVERLEVLRGPQGTFFGRNATGGALNMISKKPGPQASLDMTGEYGRYDSWLARATANVPLIADSLFARVSAYYEDSDGFLTNEGPSNATNDFRRKGARLALRHLASDAVTVDLAASWSDVQQGFPNVVPTGIPDNAFRVLGLSVFPMASGFYPANTDTIQTDADRQVANRTTLLTGRVEYNHESFTLTSVSGYIENDNSTLGEADFTRFNFYLDTSPRSVESYSTELRLASKSKSAWNWMAGAIYARDETSSQLTRTLYPEFLTVLGLPPAFANLVGPVNAFNDFEDNATRSVGVFGELGWKGLDDRLEVSFSARWAQDRIESSRYVLRHMLRPPFTLAPPTNASGVTEFDEILPRLAASFRLRDNANIYASVARGSKPGGINFAAADISTIPANFEPEKLWNYEVGLKGHFFDRRLQLGLAAFFIDWQDIQVSSSVFDPATFQNLLFTLNSTAASSRGAELEFTALPIDGLKLTGGLGYNDATFDQFPNAILSDSGVVGDASGNVVPMSTKWTFNGAGEYSHRLSTALEGFARVEYAYRGDTHLSVGNFREPPYFIPSYDVWNLRIGVNADRYTVTVFADNLAGSDHATGYLYGATATGVLAVVEPRRYGIRVNYSL